MPTLPEKPLLGGSKNSPGGKRKEAHEASGVSESIGYGGKELYSGVYDRMSPEAR